MNWRMIPLLLTLLAPGRLLADTFAIPSTTGNQLCRKAITAAERAHGIPAHLLAAIARVESGRRDRASGTFDPWPWTINMDGAGNFYDNKMQAVTAAISLRPQSTRSIDVGCMQISLTNHPDAFASMDQAFDPSANADYGARFLLQLYQKSNSWPRAVEMYHSATLDIGQEYGRRVYAALPEEMKIAELADPAITPGGIAGGFGGGYGSTVNRSLLTSSLRSPPPHVIPLATGVGGGVPPGRSLDSYRTMPVRFAIRPF
jgi:hypothetical protein